MSLKKSYINLLKQKHNSDYYLYNTYPVRFLKSETNFKEIFAVFLHDSIVLLKQLTDNFFDDILKS